MNNKLKNVLSLIGIVAIFVLVFVFAINAARNKKNKPSLVEQLARPTGIVTITDTPTPIIDENVQSINDITAFLDTFTTDLSNYTRSANPDLVNFVTPGLSLSKLSGLYAALGQSEVNMYTYWQADTFCSTAVNEGEYLVVLDVSTKDTDKKLYVYIWTEMRNNSYFISRVTYEIGDF